MQVCSICKEEYTWYGNNAQLVAEGKCCDDCNINIVIPIRIIKGKGKENGNKIIEPKIEKF